MRFKDLIQEGNKEEGLLKGLDSIYLNLEILEKQTNPKFKLGKKVSEYMEDSSYIKDIENLNEKIFEAIEIIDVVRTEFRDKVENEK